MQTTCIEQLLGEKKSKTRIDYRWSPVNKLVLLQVLAAFGNVSGHVEKIHHVQTGRMLLFAWRPGLILATARLWEEKRKRRQSN